MYVIGYDALQCMQHILFNLEFDRKNDKGIAQCGILNNMMVNK